VDADASPYDAAQRELKEELGMTAAPGRLWSGSCGVGHGVRRTRRILGLSELLSRRIRAARRAL